MALTLLRRVPANAKNARPTSFRTAEKRNARNAIRKRATRRQGAVDAIDGRPAQTTTITRCYTVFNTMTNRQSRKLRTPSSGPFGVRRAKQHSSHVQVGRAEDLPRRSDHGRATAIGRRTPQVPALQSGHADGLRNWCVPILSAGQCVRRHAIVSPVPAVHRSQHGTPIVVVECVPAGRVRALYEPRW